jgi:hypothetical protein
MLDKITLNTNIESKEDDRSRVSHDSNTNAGELLPAIRKCIRQIRVNGATAVFNLIVGMFLLATMSLGNQLPSILLIFFCISTCAVLTKAGEIILHIFHSDPLKARLPAAFIVGFTAISMSMVILTYKINLPALTSLVLCSLAVIGTSIFIPRTATNTKYSNDWRDTTSVLFIAVTIIVLAKIPLSSNAILMQSGVFPIWSDYFIHGITIATFGSPFATGGDMEIAGARLIFYHYAPFVIPAAFQTISGMSGLELSTSLLLPLGLIIAALGIYTFATEIGGRAIGSVTLILITCVPAYSLLIQSGWFEFYWLLLTAPGSGYAIGVSAVICAITAIYIEKRDFRTLCLVLTMLISLVMIRAHMFLLLAPTIIVAIVPKLIRENSKLLIGTLFGVIATAFLSLQLSDTMHDLWNKYSATQIYLKIIAGTFYFYGNPLNIPAELPYDLTIIAQVAATLAAVLGIYAVLYPPLLWVHVRRNRFKETDSIPLLLVLFFISLIIFAPIAANGDSSEYKHRHFLLLYVLFSVYTINYGISFAMSRNLRANNASIVGFGIIVLIVSTITFTYRGENPARPDIENMPWTADFHNQQIIPGLIEVSDYLRANATPGDILTMGLPSVSSIGPKTQIVQIISLTGIPAFVARSELKMLGSQCVQETVTRRLSVLSDLSLIDDWPAARNFLHANGIRWYISTADENPRWDRDSMEAVFSSNGMSVYDTGKDSGRVSRADKC